MNNELTLKTFGKKSTGTETKPMNFEQLNFEFEGLSLPYHSSLFTSMASLDMVSFNSIIT